MKLIGIVGRAYFNKDNQNIIQTHETIRKVLMNYDEAICFTLLPTEYKDYVEIVPGQDVVSNKIDYLLDKCDGFVIPGGTYYYKFDEYIINYAIKNDKPLIAICLGFQALCSMFAKNRIKFQMEETLNNENHLGRKEEYKHSIQIKNGTLLKKIIQKNEIMVNSAHHDFVNFEMSDLVVNAISEDNVIEGVELPNKKFIMGIQWHPECLNDDNSKNIFDSFISSMD